MSYWSDFFSANAATVDTVPPGYSYDIQAPGGLVRAPLGRNYQLPGGGTVTPGLNSGAPGEIAPIAPLGGSPEGGNFNPDSLITAPPPAYTPYTTVRPNTPNFPGGYTTANPPATPGWFYNSQTGQLEYGNGPGQAPTTTAPNSAGQQVPGLGGVVNPMIQSGSNAVAAGVNWIEELAIRAMLVLIGIVLIGAGFYVAGRRAVGAKTIIKLVRAPL